MISKNYYKILQVDPTAEVDIITAAYKKLALKYHPDINKSTNATKKMQDLNEAYAVLSDASRRSVYDEKLFSQDGSTKSDTNKSQKRSGLGNSDILIERDDDMEDLSSIEIENCSVYYDEKSGEVKILGEVVSYNKHRILEWREIQFLVYDVHNNILARGMNYWVTFGIRQSFNITLTNQNPSIMPTRVKVYPAKRGNISWD